jgi:hypothetical protein
MSLANPASNPDLTANPAPAQPSGQLLFYSKPEVLNAKQHSGLRLKKSGDFAFAKGSNSVAITSMEFVQAMRFYPIVFGGKTPYPVVVLGLEQENQFVEVDGRWRNAHYIPAYMRRYPFVFVAHPDGKQFILGIDRVCNRLIEDEGGEAAALFENGKPSAITQEALTFCGAYQTDHNFTLAFARALEEQNLLVDNQAQAKLADGRQVNLQGFRVIDKAKFAALLDDIIVDWHKKGWLALAYFHLASLERFQNLLEPQGAAKANGQ